jgi:signal transduction histidine kinase
MMDLLDLAQMENNTFKLNKGHFSLPEIIKKAFSIVNHVAEKKQISLI